MNLLFRFCTAALPLILTLVHFPSPAASDIGDLASDGCSLFPVGTEMDRSLARLLPGA